MKCANERYEEEQEVEEEEIHRFIWKIPFFIFVSYNFPFLITVAMWITWEHKHESYYREVHGDSQGLDWTLCWLR